ncbi:hypothetical protein FJTKL_06265 [Diaporthe vaccinii]|uniref:Acyl-CoA dehydrogenase n=1 Tax=Diaporthe vaccinii TaxID=105482 RepID=A0ABR4DQI1_9PEZI
MPYSFLPLGGDEASPPKEPFGNLTPWAEPAWHNQLESAYYNESHRKLRSYARALIEKHAIPFAKDWEAAGEAPRAAREAWVQSGLAFLDVSAEYRPKHLLTVAGIPYDQIDAFHQLILWDEISRLPSGVALALAGASVVGAPPIIAAGTEEQKRRWLPGLFDWSTSFCLGITEATAGSDVSAIRTKARKTADGKAYVVSDHKKWVTGAPWATHMVTAVRTGDAPGMKGLSLLVISMDAAGVSQKKIHNSGHNAGGSSWVYLRDVTVPAENLLGTVNAGFPIIMSNFNKERIVLAVDCNRQARMCLSEALAYAHERETFGQPLASHQIIRSKLATLAREVDAHWAWMEQVIYHVSKRGWQAKELGGVIALVKIHGARVVELAARESQQVLGGEASKRGSLSRSRSLAIYG